MNCYHCKSELRWESDVDLEDNSHYIMITFLTCTDCGTEIEVWLPREKEETND